MKILEDKTALVTGKLPHAASEPPSPNCVFAVGGTPRARFTIAIRLRWQACAPTSSVPEARPSRSALT